jgi:hypothetical protein
MKKEAFLLILILSLSAVTMLLSEQVTVHATTPWLSGWTYRKSHTLSSVSGAGNFYPDFISCHSGSGSDGNETVYGTTCGKVYLSSHCQNFPTDITFTTSDGTTGLNFWLMDSNSTWALFVVQVSANLTSSGTTIYIYYGRSGAASGSSISKTFNDTFADDFELGNLSRWTNVGYWAASASAKWRGSYGAVSSQTGVGVSYRLMKNMNLSASKIVYYWLYPASTSGYIDIYGGFPSVPKFYSLYCYYSGNHIYYYDTAYHDTGITLSASTWYLFKIVCGSGTSYDLYVYTSSGSLQGSKTSIPYRSVSILGVTRFDPEGQEPYVDDVFVRKYVSGEATLNLAWGTEQNSGNISYTFSEMASASHFALITQRVQGNCRGTGMSSPVSVTMSSYPQRGNIEIAVITSSCFSPTTVVNISQTGVSWTKVVNKYYSANNVEIWFGVISKGALQSILVAWNVTDIDEGAVVDVCEYCGVATSNYLDKTATNWAKSSINQTTDTGTTTSTTQANELWIGAIGTNHFVNQSTPRNGFTLLDGALYSPYVSLAYLEKIVSSNGTANSGTTSSGASWWAGCIATFKTSILSWGEEKAFTQSISSQSSLSSQLTKEIYCTSTETLNLLSSQLLALETAFTQTATATATAISTFGKEIMETATEILALTANLSYSIEKAITAFEYTFQDTAQSLASMTYTKSGLGVVPHLLFGLAILFLCVVPLGLVIAFVLWKKKQ